MWNSGTKQSWRADPLTIAANSLPKSVNSANWLRRREVNASFPTMSGETPDQATHTTLETSRIQPTIASRGQLVDDAAVSPGGRPSALRPIQTPLPTAILEKRNGTTKAERPDISMGLSSSNASSQILVKHLFARKDLPGGLECQAIVEPINDMDQTFGFCDCEGWEP